MDVMKIKVFELNRILTVPTFEFESYSGEGWPGSLTELLLR